jgi:hypothetical protein
VRNLTDGHASHALAHPRSRMREMTTSRTGERTSRLSR